MERLTERTAEGILVKEDYGEGALKTLYQCFGAEVAPHYANCEEGYCAMERLTAYEDAEEQGFLLRLPCKVGDTVFVIKNNADACCDCVYFEKGYCCDDYCNNKTVKDEDEDVYPSYPQYSDNPLCEKHFWEVAERETKLDWIIRNLNNFGKTVFLTKEEAEQALKQMGE